MVVLYLLDGEDKYSYQLRQEMINRSQNRFVVTSAALYTVLYRLEREGCLSSRADHGITRDRIYYHLEPPGKAILQELIAAYNTIHSGIRSIAGDVIQEE